MFVSKIICIFLSVTMFFGYIFSFGKTLPQKSDNDYGEVKRNPDKYSGVLSEVKNYGGVPTLFVNGKAYPSAAYMTYLEKFNDYQSFVNAGYTMFSVPVLFSGRWISVTDGFTPFKKGIFDEKGKPDFSLFDEAIEKILAVCPDAYIFPRVNISMPVWWEEENPDDVNIKNDGTSCRESFYSEKWRTDVNEMLRQFVRYVNSSKYASHIVGYQIAGGNTEEWFHFDMNAGFCKNAEKGFNSFLEKYYPESDFRGLPDISLLNRKSNYHNSEHLARYLEYANFATADSICYLAHTVKEETGDNVVVGTFYGYSLEVNDSLHGTHALKLILEDKNIDFICSPNSYIGIRNQNIDWTEMYPADSVRLHGKMCFQECDIRTHLTVPLCEKDPSTDPNGNLTAPIWQGLDSEEDSINAIKKSFCRQLIKGNGFWWFDMWGGWYNDKDIMNEMANFKKIYSQSVKKANRTSTAEVAVFVDEDSYKYMASGSLRDAAFSQRVALGHMGASYDMYDVYDFESVYRNYRTVIFLSGTKTEYLKKAVAVCRKDKVAYLVSTSLKKNFTEKELRAFLKVNGVHLYCETGDIIYVNDNYLAVCAVGDGDKCIKLKSKRTVAPVFESGKEFYTDTINVSMKKGEVVLFGLN